MIVVCLLISFFFLLFGDSLASPSSFIHRTAQGICLQVACLICILLVWNALGRLLQNILQQIASQPWYYYYKYVWVEVKGSCYKPSDWNCFLEILKKSINLSRVVVWFGEASTCGVLSNTWLSNSYCRLGNKHFPDLNCKYIFLLFYCMFIWLHKLYYTFYG